MSAISVITELRPLLGLLFDDISIEFDETNLLPQTIRRNGLEEIVDRLSGSLLEQRIEKGDKLFSCGWAAP